jgi:hypothetical protein
MFEILAAAVLMLSPQSPSPVIDAPLCQMEDGNADGMPCIWQDPQTEQWYWNTSANYR